MACIESLNPQDSYDPRHNKSGTAQPVAAGGRGCTHAACFRRGVCLERVSDSVKQDIRLVNRGCDLGVFVGNSSVGICGVHRRPLDAKSRPENRWDDCCDLLWLRRGLSSLAGGNIWILWLSYGILGGIGIGLGYIVPLATLVRWFPDRRGFITGLAVAGFGGGRIDHRAGGAATDREFGPLTTLAILGDRPISSWSDRILDYAEPTGRMAAGWLATHGEAAGTTGRARLHVERSPLHVAMVCPVGDAFLERYRGYQHYLAGLPDGPGNQRSECCV